MASVQRRGQVAAKLAFWPPSFIVTAGDTQVNSRIY
jgi:hypothetical protein